MIEQKKTVYQNMLLFFFLRDHTPKITTYANYFSEIKREMSHEILTHSPGGAALTREGEGKEI